MAGGREGEGVSVHQRRRATLAFVVARRVAAHALHSVVGVFIVFYTKTGSLV